MVHYKAVDVSFEGATTDSEESLDEPAAAPTEASAEPTVARLAPDADASARPAREAPIEEAPEPARETPSEAAPVDRPLPTLLRLDADFCLELARELLRSEL